MAYTRPWTRAEERQIKSCDRADLAHVARRLHRSPGAVLTRWKHTHRNATRARKYRDGINGALPVGMPRHDPDGIVCDMCQEPRRFGTEDGVCFARCACGSQLVERRRP